MLDIVVKFIKMKVKKHYFGDMKKNVNCKKVKIPDNSYEVGNFSLKSNRIAITINTLVVVENWRLILLFQSL